MRASVHFRQHLRPPSGPSVGLLALILLGPCAAHAPENSSSVERARVAGVFVTAVDRTADGVREGQFFVDADRGESTWTWMGPSAGLPASFSVSAPIVSPDATLVARFELGPGGSYLVVREVPAGSVRRIFPLQGGSLSWLPDGHIFYQHVIGRELAFSRLNILNGRSRLIARDRRGNAGLPPALTPGGEWLAYHGTVDAGARPFAVQTVMVVNARTGARATLLPPGGSCAIDGVAVRKCYLRTDVAGGGSLAWTPNGGELAVSGAILQDADGDGRVEKSDTGLLLVERATRRVTVLRRVPDGARVPGTGLSFSPDGQWLLYEDSGTLKRIDRSGFEQHLGAGRLGFASGDGSRLLNPWSRSGAQFLLEHEGILFASAADGTLRVTLSPRAWEPDRQVTIQDAQWLPAAPVRAALLQDKPPCRLALLVGVGFEPDKDEKTSETSINSVKGALKTHWKFADGDITVLLNDAATKAAIMDALDVLIQKVKDAKAEDFSACYVKIHFQGHGYKNDANLFTDLKLADGDKEKEDEGFAAADASLDNKKGFIWDHELVDRLKKLSDALNKWPKNNLIVQMDFCFAQGIYDELETKLPPNMNIAWAASEPQQCTAANSGSDSPWTTGFLGAFDRGGDVSVEAAHENAARTKFAKLAGAGSKDGDKKNAVFPSK